MQPRPASAIPTPEWYGHATELLDGGQAVERVKQRMQDRRGGWRSLAEILRSVLRKR